MKGYDTIEQDNIVDVIKHFGLDKNDTYLRNVQLDISDALDIANKESAHAASLKPAIDNPQDYKTWLETELDKLLVVLFKLKNKDPDAFTVDVVKNEMAPEADFAADEVHAVITNLEQTITEEEFKRGLVNAMHRPRQGLYWTRTTTNPAGDNEKLSFQPLVNFFEKIKQDKQVRLTEYEWNKIGVSNLSIDIQYYIKVDDGIFYTLENDIYS